MNNCAGKSLKTLSFSLEKQRQKSYEILIKMEKKQKHVETLLLCCENKSRLRDIKISSRRMEVYKKRVCIKLKMQLTSLIMSWISFYFIPSTRLIRK